MCLYCKLVPNPKYKANKKNGGIIPAVFDERVKFVPIGCGNCIECRKQKARSWQIRMSEDIKENKNGKFITLTFSNESIIKLIEQNNLGHLTGYELDNEIATRAVRLFTERWRKKFKKTIRHWLITELGHNGTENIHLHGIIWTDECLTTIKDTWSYGYVWPRYENEYRKNYVNAKTVNYIIKYITKIDVKHKFYKSIILTSKGIGANYTKSGNFRKHKFDNEKTIEYYKTESGHKISLPIYYRNKAFTEEERERLWVNKLDKNERWICGEKVKADDAKEIYKTLEWYRRINKELGYGDDEKNWNEEQYENYRRQLMYDKRKNKNNNKH